MGLRDYKEYKKRKELEELLAHFGLNLDVIKKSVDEVEILKKQCADLRAEVEALKKANLSTSVVKKEQEKKDKAKTEGKTSPEDYVKMFSGDLEELN